MGNSVKHAAIALLALALGACAGAAYAAFPDLEKMTR